MSSDQPNDKIWHTTTGDPSKPALLLLHGIFGSHVTFTPLLPFLRDHYYIILVDLPSHSRSRSPILNQYRLPQTVDAVAKLIKSVSPTGKAHVAGMSFGSFIGLSLARQHPSVVSSLFASGAPPFEGKERWFASRPRIMWYIVAATVHMPDRLHNGFCRRLGVITIPELRVEEKENFTTQLTENGYGDCVSVTLEDVGEIQGMRVAAVAGGKVDSVDVTRRMGSALRKKDPDSGSRAFVVRKAIHGWDHQFPELFADGIKCWTEGADMPGEFEELI